MGAASMLGRAQRRLDEVQDQADRKAAADAAIAAEQARQVAELEAIEAAELAEAEALAGAVRDAKAEVAKVEAAIEAERFAKVKADAEAPVGAMWAKADVELATLTATQHYEAENFRTRASMAMRAATGIDVPTELWQAVDSNMLDLRDFSGLSFRVWKIRPELRSASTNSLWSYLVRVATPSGYATVASLSDLAELSKQFPAMRSAADKDVT